MLIVIGIEYLFFFILVLIYQVKRTKKPVNNHKFTGLILM